MKTIRKEAYVNKRTFYSKQSLATDGKILADNSKYLGLAMLR